MDAMDVFFFARFWEENAGDNIPLVELRSQLLRWSEKM